MLTAQAIAEIIHGCKSGDRRAQEQLYKQFYEAMMTICLHYIKDHDDAIEVLNGGFLKIFLNIDKYQPSRGALYTWMRKIMVNCCIDFINALKARQKEHELDTCEEIYLPPDVLNKLSADELIRQLNALPKVTKAVFNLFVIEGYRHKEIAAMMRMSEGTSKWHLNEAKKLLKEKLSKKYDP